MDSIELLYTQNKIHNKMAITPEKVQEELLIKRNLSLFNCAQIF